MQDVEELIRRLPPLLDQDYNGLSEEAKVGNGGIVIQAARRIYNIHCHPKRILSEEIGALLDDRLRRAAYAVNAAFESIESGEAAPLSPGVTKGAYRLFESIAGRLNMSYTELQRACV